MLESFADALGTIPAEGGARDAYLRRLAAADPQNAQALLEFPVQLAVERLPFYPGARVVRAFVELRGPPLQLSYLDSATGVVPLSGAAASIEAFNAQLKLSLAAADVAAYLRFFIANSAAGIDFRIAEHPDSVAWLPLARKEGHPAKARADEARRAIKPIAVFESEGTFCAVVVGLSHRGLQELTVDVSKAGRVTLLAHRCLVEDLPVPFVR